MPALTPNVGVRTFLNRVETAPLLIADMSTIGGVFTPGTGIDRTVFPAEKPVLFNTSDSDTVAKIGTGTLRDTVNQCLAQGLDVSIVANVPDILVTDTADQQMAKMVGTSSAKTGIWAMLESQGENGCEPDILIAPGYTSTRPGNAANPVVTAMDAICERIITAIAIQDAASSDRTAAIASVADFATSLNIVSCAQAVRVSSNGLPVVKPSSPSVAALIAETDKVMGGPYYSPGNRTLRGILGPSRNVTLNLSDPDCEANYLLQRGVNSIVQLEKNRTSLQGSPTGKTFWGFFNTSNDPLWRMINVVRTRKAVREVLPRTLAQYIGKNLGPHLVTTIIASLNQFLSELQALPEPAILGGRVTWNRALNSNAVLQTGGLVINLDFEEAPALVDLQIYTGRYSAAFNILAEEITSAMQNYNVQGTLG